MQLKELEQIETPDYKKQENSGRIQESDALEENCGQKDFKLDSVIDVSGKTLDFPLINGEERSVEEVYMYKNELNLIPTAMGRLKNLKTLKFFSNAVNLFPREFGNLVELECLQVKVAEPGINGLDLSKLTNLKELELSRVPPRLSAFPLLSEIAGLKCLTRLSVCHFSIRYLPPEIGCLNNLEYLDLSFNKMRNLPDEITSLNLLIHLKVTNNKLIDLPLRLSCLQRLEILDLSNNRLTSLQYSELESMHNLRILNLQHNQLRRCRIPSWICCNLGGNVTDLSNDESAEMDVYDGVIQEIHGSCVAPLSNLSGLSPNNRSLAARRGDGWKRRYNLQTKARQERLNYCRKWKVDAAAQSSSEKCMTCIVSGHSDNASSKDLSVVPEEKLSNEDLSPECEVQGNSVTGPGREDFGPVKEYVKACSCPAIDSDGIHKEVGYNAALGSLSDNVEVLDGGSSSQYSHCVQKPKRHSEEDLYNPKPTKSRRPTNDPSYLSCLYSKRSFCGVADHLPDGFYDAGRDRPFMPLGSYEKKLHANLREVILLDRERDEELDAILLRARAFLHQFKQFNKSINDHKEVALDSLQMASLLALFVSDHFGGSDKSAVIQRTRKTASGSNYMKPFVCTCATGIIDDTSKAARQGVHTAEGVVFHDICEKSLQSIKERRNSIIVPIGGVQFGVCRHRALLMKYLCDRIEPQIPCELVRGYLDFSPHAWNVMVINRGESLVRMIVDACHPHDIREESDPEYFCRYIPLSRVCASVVTDHDASPNCSFPSLAVCDEIGKLASTSLMRCTVGSLEAAVKVRTIDVSEASADEVRNFEFSCLGEVRMLSVLKHSCIVECYGHQISSKWPETTNGNSGRRILQSAILMEYIRGGSLKCYVEKLSSAGEKHVAPDLALAIARDVAFALTELHSRLIIHRDIKSENILIDLEKQQPDGTPIVKLCDFDRAIPLHSYLHTCCIAHVGIPRPDICVGTPRWMAPEVFCAMHKRNIYGLEVDIWSFGCMLLELLTLQVPYSELPEPEIHRFLQMGERPKLTDELEALAQSETDLETDSETLRFLAKLYHQCTEKNPSDRPSAKNIYNMLLAHERSVKASRSSEQE
ncbi:putative serine/threonine-protein kinase DDB [Sesamum alatum]|uniref:Serine/threonine-protein kinase DDB n=1 Tax=Sesamum alatum TaxID=300844 RepID=A0AAE2CTL9_9LAMI|nr:putative serine/threonine-protein kinase DDB [Sesamum alatum]